MGETGSCVSQWRRRGALTSSLDQQLEGYKGALLALATSSHSKSDNLSAFYQQAEAPLEDYRANSIVLINEHGQERINIVRPFVERLPMTPDTEVLRRVFETRRPVVSNIFFSGIMPRPLVSISVPVRNGDEVRYLLGMGVAPDNLAATLNQQKLPARWIATIFDASGRISIPRGDVTREMQRTLVWPVIGSFLLPVGSVVLASVIGRRIAKAIGELTGPAHALAYGALVTVPYLPLEEAHQVGQALVNASKMLREAQHRAQHDVMTGLANRSLFNEIADQQLAVYDRSGAAVTVLYLDLDRFKSVNDTYGHATGDLLLKAVADRLKAAVRATDVPARVGGDEFAVLLAHADAEKAPMLAEKLVADLSREYDLNGHRIQLSVSNSLEVARSGRPSMH